MSLPTAIAVDTPSPGRWRTGLSIVIADEPTASLDPITARRVLAAVMDLVKELGVFNVNYLFRPTTIKSSGLVASLRES